MPLDVVRLTNTTDGYSYDITMIQDSSQGTSKDAFSIAPPGQGPKDNILLGVSGMQSDVRFSFSIHNDGTDKSNGTGSNAGFGSVVTLAEQREWLQEYIHAPTFSARWELDHLNGDMVNNLPIFVETIDVPLIVQGSPKWLEASIGFRVGESVG